MELRQFRYFIAVAEERHFGRAAARLHIAQPGLSQQIKALERSLDAPLLIRNPRGVELTAAGRVFLDQARLAVEVAERAAASASLAARGKTGLLRVGAPIFGMPPAGEAVMRTFADRFPDVELEVHPDLHPHLIDGVSNHSLDVAVVLFPFKAGDPPPRYLPLSMLELVAVVPKGHRLAKLERIPPAELLDEPFLDWPRSINPDMVDHIDRLVFGDVEHPRVVISELQESRRFEYVANGTGIAITVTREPLNGGSVPGVVFRSFEEPVPMIGYGVAWSSTRVLPPAEAFVEVAREHADLPRP